ncbi:MAG: DUF58 domain-containing protein [Streptosporangiaceae bacterium]
MVLTGRAALAALAGLVALLAFRTVVAIIVVDLVLIAAIGADVRLAASVSGIRLSRTGDTRISLGQSGSVTLSIENGGHRQLRAVVRDAWRPSAGAQPRRSRVSVPAGGRVAMTTVLTPSRRGDTSAIQVTIRSIGPLGLAGRQGHQAAEWIIRVLPPFLSRKHLPEKLAMLRDLEGQHRSLLRGQGSEFDSLRQYVLGDDVRSIDWRSSARRTEVVVRTWRPERDRRIVIVLDTGRTAAGRVAGVPRLDTFMDSALLLAALATRAGDRIDLLAADRRIRARVTGISRPASLSALSDAMANLEAELIEPDARLVATAVMAMARQRCLVIFLTDLNPSALEQGLLPGLQLLASRHRLLVGAVADPRLAELAMGRGSAAAVYAAAAAERARSERARASALLQRRGVQVVDAPPDALPAALADAYLSLKAAGRL